MGVNNTMGERYIDYNVNVPTRNNNMATVYNLDNSEEVSISASGIVTVNASDKYKTRLRLFIVASTYDITKDIT